MTKTTVIIGESESDRGARELCAALQEAAMCAVVHFDGDHAAEVLETFAALLLHDAAGAVKAGVAAGREMLEAERPATAYDGSEPLPELLLGVVSDASKEAPAVLRQATTSGRLSGDELRAALIPLSPPAMPKEIAAVKAEAKFQERSVRELADAWRQLADDDLDWQVCPEARSKLLRYAAVAEWLAGQERKPA